MLTRLFKEPLVQFLPLGVGLYFTCSLFAPRFDEGGDGGLGTPSDNDCSDGATAHVGPKFRSSALEARNPRLLGGLRKSGLQLARLRAEFLHRLRGCLTRGVGGQRSRSRGGSLLHLALDPNRVGNCDGSSQDHIGQERGYYSFFALTHARNKQSEPNIASEAGNREPGAPIRAWAPE